MPVRCSGTRLAWFRALTAPRSVAVVGATDKRETFSGAVLTNLIDHGFAGDIYPVNPRRDRVGGLECFPHLGALPEVPDCVVMVVSADLAINAVEEASALGVPAGIVVASGFTEGGAGTDGAARTQRLRSTLAGSEMRILGPSTTGLINLHDDFVPRAALNQLASDRVSAGPVTLIAQSGACGNIVYGMGQMQGLPIGLAVSTGLQLDLDVWDWFEALLADGRTGTALLLIEDMGPATRWAPLLRDARNRGIGVVLCHAGRTDRGADAARTHTGAVAGDWAAEEALVRSTGAVVVPALEDLWHVGSLCHRWGAPTGSSRRTLGVISMSGGEGALLADAASEAGLSLPPLSADTEALVGARMPLGAPGNPLDPTGAVMGRPDAARDLASAFLDTTDYAAYLVALPGLDSFLADEIAGGMLVDVAARAQPVAVSGWWFDDEARRLLAGTGLPTFDASSTALNAINLYLGKIAPMERNDQEGEAWPTTDVIVAGDAGIADGGKAGRDYSDALALAASLGIITPAGRVVSDVDAAEAAAEALGYPVVVKANTPSTVHKARRGLVRTGLRSAADVREAAGTVAEGWSGELVVEEHVLGDFEVLLGVRRTERTGMVAVFGSGGRMVEIHRDVVAVPVDFIGAVRSQDLARTRVGRAIHAVAPHLLADLAQVLERLVEHARSEGVASLEINPALVQLERDTVVALDLRIDSASATPEPLAPNLPEGPSS